MRPARPSMAPYLAVLAVRSRTLLQYRGAALGALVAQTFFGLVRVMVLDGFYASSTTVPGLGFRQAAGYVWVCQATLAMFPWNSDPEIREQVRTGTVVYELCRPLDLYYLWYARATAWRAAPTLIRALPMMAIAALLLPALGLGELGLPAPAGAGAALAWLLATAGALLLSSALTVLIHVGVLWALGIDGVPMLIMSLATICGGLIIPLPLFPDWAQTLLAVQPFAGFVDLPARLYVGQLAPGAIAWVLPHQLGWTLAIGFLGRRLLGRVARRLVVQGG